MAKIMIIEDELTVREELSILLNNAGYETVMTDDFEHVPEKIKEQNPDLILLDINLPGQDGYEICKSIRSFSDASIIFITSRNGSMDELKAFTLGGDDYITKPYNIPVLMARIQTVLKRKQVLKEEPRKLEHGGVELDLAAGHLIYNSEEIELTKNEIKILFCLFQNGRDITNRTDIIDYLWDNGVYIDDNTLSVHVTRIRDKMKEIGITEFIHTKRGMGYRLSW